MVTGTEFGLLGPLTVRCSGAVIPIQAGRQRTVLAALLLSVGRVVPVDELAEMLWGPVPPPTARVTVQNYVMRLRKALGSTAGARISTRTPGYLMQVDAGELDVTRFEELLGDARAAARDGSWDQAATWARGALGLWRGEPLADVDSEVLSAREVPRLDELRLQALETRIDADLHLGRHAEIVAELRKTVGTHPLREHLHGLLMLALYRDGRQAEALVAYQAARRMLVEELGTEPGAALRRLHHQVLTADSGLDFPETDQPAAGAGELSASRWPPALPPTGQPEARPQRHRPHLPFWAGWVIIGAILVTVAAVLEVTLTNSPIDPATTSAAPPAHRAPAATGPVCGSLPSSVGPPALCVTQPVGGETTVFTLREQGFKPGTKLVLTVIFYPPPPQSGPPPQPIILRVFTVTADGSFRLGPLQLGLYKVMASDAAGSAAGFRVVPLWAAPLV